ncbi:AAA family ATPase [Streptococcus infantis]|uniref:AAA family ATPase n=1 Tax=Streptococcus infantis TaxID=68892 RepID=UPI0039C4C07C
MTGCGVEDMINFFKKYPFRRKIWKRNFPLSDKDYSSLDDGIYYAFDHWNDYGYRTLYALTAKIEGEIYDFGSLKLSFIPYRHNEEIDLQSILDKEEKYNLISFGDKEYYEFLNKFLTSAEKDEYFKKMGDIAYDLDRLDEAIENDSIYYPVEDYYLLKNSFLRSVTLSEIRNQFHRLSMGGNYVDEYQISIIDKNGNNVLEFRKDPHSIEYFPDTLYAIVGNNGAGKTYFIKNLIDLYIEKNSDLFKNSTSNINQFESIVLISYSPFDTGIIKKDRENYKFIGIDFNQTTNLEDYITEEIKTLFKEAATPKNKNRTKKIIDKFSFDPLFMRILPLVEERELSEDIINELSSGQKIVLLSLLNLIIKVFEKTLVIIDEPELFLHPPLLKAYIRGVEEIVEEGNGVCLLATHSAIVLQEVPNTNIRKLKYDFESHMGSIVKLSSKTYGESISFINDTIFGTDLRNTGFYKVLQDKIGEEQISDSFEAVLGSEARIILQLSRELKTNEED